MRIIISSSTYYPAMNGQAVFTTNLAEGLAKRGHSVVVILDSRHAQASRNVINGVVIEELRSIRLNIFQAGVYFSPYPGREISRIFDLFQPEIVHIQDHYPSCRATMLEACRRRIKTVGSNHFIPENLAPYVPLLSLVKPVIFWMFWQWMRDVYQHADVITAQSRAAADIIRQTGLQQPILPISCGIDLQRLFPNPDEDRKLFCQRYGLDPHKKIFLFLGRIDGEKRIDLLAHAMKQLPRDDVQMAIAGHGRVEKTLRRMVKKMGLTQKVKFTGFIPEDDVLGLMNSADVFVMPSEAELLSISTLEAMACGKPVLLANALALPELVQDGVNGYLFKPGSVEDLVMLINYMADHPEQWAQMGVASREIVKQHSLEDTIFKFEGVYSGLISETPQIKINPQVKEPV
jgi:1,2-diacylglycerol 3-alpha-glucosyltransferase